MSSSIIFISGPTAIGKSDLALELASVHNGEIINSDSMQVYSELEILTARPNRNDLKLTPHHLYGHVSGNYRYNVAKWCKAASKIVKHNMSQNKKSIIVGGTGLYIDSLLNGINEIPDIEEDYKKESKKLLESLGKEKFYEKVYKIDKASCEKISKNDSQRLQRIWEVYQVTGLKLSEWNKNKNKQFFNDCDYEINLFFPKRNEIYKRVNERFLKMVKSGAIEEVRNLLSLNIDNALPVMKAHGVPEISQYLSGKISLEDCIAKAQQVTRNYVKRQTTWWRSKKMEFSSIFYDFPSNIDKKSLNLSN